MAVVDTASSDAATRPAARPNRRRPRSATARTVRPPATALGRRVSASGASAPPRNLSHSPMATRSARRSAPARPHASVRPRSSVGSALAPAGSPDGLTAMRGPYPARCGARTVVRDALHVPAEQPLDALADGDARIESEEPARLLDLRTGGEHVRLRPARGDEVGAAPGELLDDLDELLELDRVAAAEVHDLVPERPIQRRHDAARDVLHERPVAHHVAAAIE